MKISAAALLFDNDGTLVSSLDSVHRCWARWAEESGIAADDFARVELHGRPAAAEIIGDLLPAARVPEALARIEQLEYEDVPGGTHPLPGTHALLAGLPPERWAVVTSATAPWPRPGSPRPVSTRRR
ncbi:HAD family hydrolase OS=Streptomyces rimosus subsp. rimosus (strain ATCC / DSM 40260 / JCM 4667/ NRRL 2234) OX=1265868 GN=SRIM_007100 PE=4 SV=1 [Streptomyces rimosus subsp. rimosus]